MPHAEPPETPALGGSNIREGMFSALKEYNFRLFFCGQAVSLIGTWMQSVAQAWLVLQITHSGTALGMVVAAQFAPVLLLGPYGGVVADRFDKRRIIIATQSVQCALALTLAIITATGAVKLWAVIVIAVMLGTTNAIDAPTRQAFVMEMVGRARVRNAVSLNSVLVSVARAVGPAVAGVLIATTSLSICFFINAGSFVAVLISLTFMRVHQLDRAEKTNKASAGLREGLAYVRQRPALFAPLLMMVIIGTLAYEFQVVLPVLVSNTFHGGADDYGVLTSCMGAGSVVAGLVVARNGRSTLTVVSMAAAFFGVAIAVTALTPSIVTAGVALVFVGAGSVGFLSMGNSLLQLGVDPEYRGRVLALWTTAFLGTTPIGGPIVGAVAEHFSPRWSLALGAAACLVAASFGWITDKRIQAGSSPETTAAAA